MKKLLKFVLLLTVSAFLLPAGAVLLQNGQHEEIFVPQPFLQEEDTIPAPEMQEKAFDLSHSVTVCVQGEVRELSLQEYLVGVLAAEMPAGFPEEALKAQAVAARTYTLYKTAIYAKTEPPESHHGAQLCDDPAHCEAFADLSLQAGSLWGEHAEVYCRRLLQAVSATDGLCLIYEEEPIAAVFCAASAEKTESSADVWGSNLPYLVSVDSPGGSDCGKYEGTLRISRSEFIKTITAAHPEADFSKNPGVWFSNAKRTGAGSVSSISVGGVSMTGGELRQLLGLNSANFKVKTEGDDLIFTTVGYGHGVGMSQYGARYFALAGQTFDQILAHYYPGTQLLLQK